MTLELASTIDTLKQLEATLAALTGSAGTSELEDAQIDAVLTSCHRLSFEALRGVTALA